MTYGLPTRGQRDWDDELNNSVESLRSEAQTAVAASEQARSNATEAIALAQDAAAKVEAFRSIPDAATASLVTDGPLTSAALSAAYGRPGVAATVRTRQKIEQGLEDVHIALIGDSTGDGLVTTASEWFPLLGPEIAALFPTHTVKTRLWSAGPLTWGSWTTLQTGTGARTIWLHNGSAAGENTTYHQAHYSSMWTGVDMDLLFVSHGHNETDHDTTVRREMAFGRFLALTEAYKAKQPKTELVMIAQPPDLANNYQAERAQAIATVAQTRGYGLVDVHQAFVDTGDVASYLDADGVHPNAAGGQLWMETVLPIFSARPGTTPPLTSAPSSFLTPAPDLLANGMLLGGNGLAPLSWVAQNLATMEYDATLRAKKFIAVDTASNNLKHTVAATATEAAPFAGRWVTFAALTYKTAESVNVGRIIIDDGVSVSTDAGVKALPDTGQFVWQVVTKYIDPAATQIVVGIFPTITGTAPTPLWVRRATLAVGMLPHDNPEIAARRSLALIPAGDTAPAFFVDQGGANLTGLPAIADMAVRMYRYATGTQDSSWWMWATGNDFHLGTGGLVERAVRGSETPTKIISINRSGSGRIGFYGVTPVARPTAYNQQYSTASRVHATYTSDVESSAYTAAADGEAKLADLNALRVAYENLRASHESTKQVLNSILDDLQTLGLLQ